MDFTYAFSDKGYFDAYSWHGISVADPLDDPNNEPEHYSIDTPWIPEERNDSQTSDERNKMLIEQQTSIHTFLHLDGGEQWRIEDQEAYEEGW